MAKITDTLMKRVTNGIRNAVPADHRFVVFVVKPDTGGFTMRVNGNLDHDLARQAIRDWLETGEKDEEFPGRTGKN